MTSRAMAPTGSEIDAQSTSPATAVLVFGEDDDTVESCAFVFVFVLMQSTAMRMSATTSKVLDDEAFAGFDRVTSVGCSDCLTKRTGSLISSLLMESYLFWR